MNLKQKNSILFIFFAFIMGACSGLFVWLFFQIMNFSIHLLWHVIPDYVSIPFYTIILCTLGGLIIGLFRKKFGDYPEELNTVIKKVKEDGKYSYHNILPMSVSALLPLVFGASIGPEAGLTGVIAGLCSWVSDKIKKAGKEIQEFTKLGISATLGTIFNSPMFGFMEPIESENENTVFPKTSKIILYFSSILGAMGIFMLLKNLFGGNSGLPSFDFIQIGTKEWLYLLPLILIGTVVGFLFFAFGKIISKTIKPIHNYPVINSLIAGFILGVIGTILPFTMFSGEEQMVEIMNNWVQIGTIILFLTGIVKLFLTNICIHMGLKGGHFFPIIFSGVCIGYSLSILLGVDSIFCVTVITTSLVACTLRKPLATVLLLMICFPTNAIFIMLISAIVATLIKLPKVLEKDY